MAAVALLPAATACLQRGDAMNTPPGWQHVKIGDSGITIAVPPDAQAQKVNPIDSIFGNLRGTGYEVTYDYGRYGAALSDHKNEPDYEEKRRTVDGRDATEVSYTGDGSPWRVVRGLQVRSGQHTLTVYVSCADKQACGIADTVFDSVRF